VAGIGWPGKRRGEGGAVQKIEKMERYGEELVIKV